MGRIRTLKPEFCTSQSTGALSREARLFFVQLFTDADDEGRLVYSPKRLAGLLYPWDDDVGDAEIERWTKECESQGMLRRYSGASREGDGEPQKLLQIVNWKPHQKISHPTRSRLAPPPNYEVNGQVTGHSGDPPESLGKPPETFRSDLGSRTWDLGSRINTLGVSDETPCVAGESQIVSGQDEVWETLLAVFEIDVGSITSMHRGKLNKAAKELHDVGATPQQIRDRAAAYRLKYPRAAFTPLALVSNWGELTPSSVLAPPPSKHDVQLMRWAAGDEQ